MNPHARVGLGLVRTFQINQLFGSLTPLQSLALAVGSRLGAAWRWWQPVGSDAAIAAECERLLAQFRLTDHADKATRELPYGKRRLLEIGLAVAMKPSVLLLDEPAAGVPATERKDILDTVAALPADVSVLLIEHDMDLVFSFARRITVLVNGAVLTEGARGVAADPEFARCTWVMRTRRVGGRHMAERLLAVEGLTCGYGEAVVSNVSFALDAGRSLALLGRNGTGKTTVIDTLVGVTRRHAGRIELAGQAIHALPAHNARLRASAGAAGAQHLQSLTVHENLTAVAAWAWTVQRVFQLFPRLAERQHNLGAAVRRRAELAFAHALVLNLTAAARRAARRPGAADRGRAAVGH